MLKFFFWTLLLANAALFAYQQGHLEMVAPSGREPARMASQISADKVRLIPPAAAEKAAAVAKAAAEPQKMELSECIEIGNFDLAEARRFEERLVNLLPGDRISQRRIREVLSHMVYIPPQGDREAAEKKAAELRGLGIGDFYIIQDNSTLQFAVSLGVFKLEEGARMHLADLTRRGVRSARIGPYSMSATMVAFQLRGLDDGMKAGLDKIKSDFSTQATRSCAAG